MKKVFFHIFLFILTGTAASPQTAGTAGSFARMGFGARGLSMGNALTAVAAGEIYTYYNPALSAFSDQKTASVSFGILSLDRHINFLSYTQAVKPTAGISFGLINAGVGKIDGRDANGAHTDEYSTYENQVYLAFSNRVDPAVSIGIAVKLYHSKLFEEVKSTTVGIDAGVCVRVTENIFAALAVQDIGSKYSWDTHLLYPDPMGKSTTDKFPSLRRAGAAYLLPSGAGVVSAEFENSSAGTNVLRFGAEYNIVEYFTVRGGMDRIDFGDYATGAKPSFGFTARKALSGWRPAVTYGFIYESFAPHGMHIITLSTTF